MSPRRSLGDAELESLLATLPEWTRSSSPDPGQPGSMRHEIVRKFEFASFEAAMGFMQEAAKHVARVDHHPRWENAWKTVTVWLSTWDSGHKITMADIELARHLDLVFASYGQRRSPKGSSN